MAPVFTAWKDAWWPPANLGKRGELATERWLLKAGWIIIERGYQDRFGEIDLIAVENDSIVFVEVKTRTHDELGDPAEAVDESKQKRITQTAKGYLKWHDLTEYPVRFDVVSIVWHSKKREPEIVHYRNAFEPTGDFQLY